MQSSALPTGAGAGTAPADTPRQPAHSALILDTNIVLDLLLFGDPATAVLRQRLAPVANGASTCWQWIATPPMRDELAHVLGYTHLQPRMAYYQRDAAGILARFDASVRLVEVPPATTVLCRDGDDQKFIDLAIAHRATLLSKDKQVLKLRKRLARLDVVVGSRLLVDAA